MTALPLIEALDLRPTTEPASPDEYVWDWPIAPRSSTDTGCGHCHGDGVVTVSGYSVNPFNGARGQDPQEAVDVECPDCGGTGLTAPTFTTADEDAEDDA